MYSIFILDCTCHGMFNFVEPSKQERSTESADITNNVPVVHELLNVCYCRSAPEAYSSAHYKLCGRRRSALQLISVERGPTCFTCLLQIPVDDHSGILGGWDK
jgi:hypothetical protein